MEPRDQLENELKELVAKGLTVTAIKKYREVTGCNLAEALNWYNQTYSASLDGMIAKLDEPPQRWPCPYCGKSLRSDGARQCFECGKDWHDPDQIVQHEVVSRNG